MLKSFKIFWHSLLMALQELRVNKLRTFLSLLGITIGIFCIIAVFTLTKSLEMNVKSELSSLGSNVVYVQRWPWGNTGSDWWKYIQRPETNYDEYQELKQRIHSASAFAYVYDLNNKTIALGDNYMQNVTMLAVTDGFDRIQQINLEAGRFFTPVESRSSSMTIILGANIWQGLFNSAQQAIGSQVQFAGRVFTVIGVLKTYGESLVGAFDYDNSVLVSYASARQIANDRSIFVEPFIMVKAASNVNVQELKDELRGAMRAIRRLKPAQDDNFALNELSMTANDTDKIFSSINFGGLVIGIFALIVGAFGIANIMFVTVKERTNIIGLKKAIGAKRRVILQEFLIESVVLCLIGGILGMLCVFGVTKLISSFVFFKIYMTSGIIIMGLAISIITGIIAGYIPAFSASKLNPVVAIRS
ncbi:MAG: FtsX-like permease family protein [Chitinophagaceae bacterium]|jgi:putative ABC transport system permease protein|nr:MAG: FtsX-like permease family protein [Chitinophagaceae bacterium]